MVVDLDIEAGHTAWAVRQAEKRRVRGAAAGADEGVQGAWRSPNPGVAARMASANMTGTDSTVGRGLSVFAKTYQMGVPTL
jgi:hypothetical protein